MARLLQLPERVVKLLRVTAIVVLAIDLAIVSCGRLHRAA